MLMLLNDAAGRTEAESVDMVISELEAGGAEVEVAACTGYSRARGG